MRANVEPLATPPVQVLAKMPALVRDVAASLKSSSKRFYNLIYSNFILFHFLFHFISFYKCYKDILKYYKL